MAARWRSCGDPYWDANNYLNIACVAEGLELNKSYMIYVYTAVDGRNLGAATSLTPASATVRSGTWRNSRAAFDYMKLTYPLEVDVQLVDTFAGTLLDSIRKIIPAPGAVPPALHGYLSVKSSPIGAAVSANGTSCGTTPVTTFSLPIGMYTLKVEKSEYTPYSTVISIADAKTTDLGTVTLMPTGVPTGPPTVLKDYVADNYGVKGCITEAGMDDLTLACMTDAPLRGTLPAGYVTSDICSAAVFDWGYLNIGWCKGAVVTVGYLSVNTSPGGATVSINGVSCGKTPVTTCEVGTGAKTVTISLTGYVPQTRSVTIPEGATQNLGTITLTPTPPVGEVPYQVVEIYEPGVGPITGKGVIHILTPVDAAGATVSSAGVYVDNVYLHHYAPEDLTFCSGCKCDTYVACEFGTHTIKVEKDKYNPWSVTVNIQDGMELTYTPLLTIGGVVPTGEATVTAINIPARMAIGTSYTGSVTISASVAGTFYTNLDFHPYPAGWDKSIASLPASVIKITTESKAVSVGTGYILAWTWKVPKITTGTYVVVSRLYKP